MKVSSLFAELEPIQPNPTDSTPPPSEGRQQNTEGSSPLLKNSPPSKRKTDVRTPIRHPERRVDCLHWHWRHSGQRQTEYRQTLQHDGGNVSHIYRLETVDNESISSMDSQDTFAAYIGRFLGRLLKDSYEWPRDNILLAFFMVAVPPAAVWLRDPTHIPDWVVIKTAGWLYLALFLVYAIYHVIRTPWKLDVDRVEQLEVVKANEANMRRKLKEIEDAKPNIILRDPGAEHIENMQLNLLAGKSAVFPLAVVRFVNKHREDRPNVEAKKIRAKVNFYDYSGALALEMDGRWSDSSQPSTRVFGVSRNDLLPIDFGVEEAHSLDIAYWDRDQKEFIAWNNDSYDFPLGRKPNHILPGNLFTVEIRLISEEVNAVFRFHLSANLNGPTIRRA
jgi:hypothetical protein